MVKNLSPEPSPSLEVAVSVPVQGTFSYSIPESLKPLALVGCRVLVPFNHRRVTGYVVKKNSKTPDRSLKEIEDLLDPKPLFHQRMVPFFKWIADYYRHPLGMVIHASLPGERFKSAILTKKGEAFLEGNLFETEDGRILAWIGKNAGKKIPWPMKKIYPLQEKGSRRRHAG